ncbi:MAG: hypothetical protein K2X35_13280 [Bryobacteraceae bacterium]|nr:hypothetical protein [Bryobacteraceae bacterium]
MTILWAAMAGSVFLYYLIGRLVPPGEASDPSLLAAPLLGVAGGSAAISFFLRSVFTRRAVERKDPALLRTAYVIAFVFAETPAILGLVTHFATGWQYSWVFFFISLGTFALHFPSQGKISDAMDAMGK